MRSTLDALDAAFLRHLTEAQRQVAGIGQGLVRLAVGLEHVDDITDDLQRGLGAC